MMSKTLPWVGGWSKNDENRVTYYVNGPKCWSYFLSASPLTEKTQWIYHFYINHLPVCPITLWTEVIWFFRKFAVEKIFSQNGQWCNGSCFCCSCSWNLTCLAVFWIFWTFWLVCGLGCTTSVCFFCWFYRYV